MYIKSHFGILLSKPAVKDLTFPHKKQEKRRKVIHKINKLILLHRKLL